jgi:hypothetical protein
MKVLKCPYPHSRDQCRGHIPRKIWESLVPIESLQKRAALLTGEGHVVGCSNCLILNKIAFPEQEWVCHRCKRVSCGRCDSEYCTCLNVIQTALSKGYSRFFSKILGGTSVPMRRHEITYDMVVDRIKSLTEHAPWFHIKCPSCEINLFKSSACNDMHHCGLSHSCYFCSIRSFPWEKGILQEHWSECFRWDHDHYFYKCREGECINDGDECSDVSHAPGISKLHNMRFRASLKALLQDISSQSFYGAIKLLYEKYLDE